MIIFIYLFFVCASCILFFSSNNARQHEIERGFFLQPPQRHPTIHIDDDGENDSSDDGDGGDDDDEEKGTTSELSVPLTVAFRHIARDRLKMRSLSKRDLILLSALRVFRSSSSTCCSSPSFNSEDDTVIKAVIETSWFGCRLNPVLFRRSPARCRRCHISSGPCRTYQKTKTPCRDCQSSPQKRQK